VNTLSQQEASQHLDTDERTTVQTAELNSVSSTASSQANMSLDPTIVQSSGKDEEMQDSVSTAGTDNSLQRTVLSISDVQ
jgi:hypothetical protein